ncbi:hypothetical protein L873DRAFT_1810904, partial [Choiromyces venosus 120613-1]
MVILAGEQTPLHVAVCLGLIPLAEKALSSFLEAEGGESNQSPLHLAAKFMSRTYKILIEEGQLPLLRAKDQDGNTPMHQAVISGYWPMLVALVKRFATL